jgi:hypothetical protein
VFFGLFLYPLTRYAHAYLWNSQPIFLLYAALGRPYFHIEMETNMFRTIVVMLLIAVPLLSIAQTPAPRAARSVHLFYSAPEGLVFYNEVNVKKTVPGSYFELCGWNCGYFGIQELGKPDQKVAIFSVWDTAGGDNPNSTPKDQRVEVLYTGKGVDVSRFGGEGTGAHCTFPFPWKTNQTYRCMVETTITGDKTSYTGWIYLNDEKQWKKLATFQRNNGPSPLSGYYSFIEDFRRDGKSVNETRQATFSNGWVRTVGGDWVSLTRAKFTADSTPLNNVNAVVNKDGFELSTGGNVKNINPIGTQLSRNPDGFQLPEGMAVTSTYWSGVTRDKSGHILATITEDSSAAPDLAAWGVKAGELCALWYPKINTYLASPGFVPPSKVKIIIVPMDGVAYTLGDVIHVSADYVRGHQDDIGLVVHELTHVVQSYPGGAPGWLVEGIADYVRFGLYEPQHRLPPVNPQKSHYTDAYQTTAAFLIWLNKNEGKGIVPIMNAAMREQRYSPDLWKEHCGKSLDDLWNDYIHAK